MAKTKPAPKKSPAGVTGTYRYDRETGEVVLVSDGVPKVASKGRGAAPSPCGEGACAPRRSSGGCGGGGCGS